MSSSKKKTWNLAQKYIKMGVHQNRKYKKWAYGCCKALT